MMEELAPFRRRIDELDDKIVRLLAERFAVVRQVAEVKRSGRIPSVLPERIEEVKARAAQNAAPLGLDPSFTRRLYGLIIDEACRLEDYLIDAR